MKEQVWSIQSSSPQNENSGHAAWDPPQFNQLSLVDGVSSEMNLLCD